MASDAKRAWFQIRLSTAIVLMFVAAALVWANTHRIRLGENSYIQGWPLPFYYSQIFQQRLGFGYGPFEPVLLVVDSIVAITILSASGAACELVWKRTALVTIVSVIISILLAGLVAIVVVALAFGHFVGLHYYGK